MCMETNGDWPEMRAHGSVLAHINEAIHASDHKKTLLIHGQPMHQMKQRNWNPSLKNKTYNLQVAQLETYIKTEKVVVDPEPNFTYFEIKTDMPCDVFNDMGFSAYDLNEGIPINYTPIAL